MQALRLLKIKIRVGTKLPNLVNSIRLLLQSAAPISIRRRSAKGATMVEMALLISLILGVALLATESMGTQTACSFYKTGMGLGARGFHSSVAEKC